MSYFVVFSCLKVMVCSCTAGYTVAQFSIMELHYGQSIQYCAYGEISAIAYRFV